MEIQIITYNKTSVASLVLVSNRCELFYQHSLLKVFCRPSLRICKRGWKWSSCLRKNMIFIFFHQLFVWIYFNGWGFVSPTVSLRTFSALDEICCSLRQTETARKNPWILIVVLWELFLTVVVEMRLQILCLLLSMNRLLLACGGPQQVCF